MTPFDPSRLDPFALTDTDVRMLTERGRRERSVVIRHMLSRVFRRP